jgi:hypothetical protein
MHYPHPAGGRPGSQEDGLPQTLGGFTGQSEVTNSKKWSFPLHPKSRSNLASKSKKAPVESDFKFNLWRLQKTFSVQKASRITTGPGTRWERLRLGEIVGFVETGINDEPTLLELLQVPVSSEFGQDILGAQHTGRFHSHSILW